MVEIFRITALPGAGSPLRAEITPDGVRLLAAMATAMSHRGHASHADYLANLNLLRDVLYEAEEVIEIRASEELDALREQASPAGACPDV